MKRLFTVIAVCAASLLSAGCDKLGIESADTIVARKEAEGKAIGGACRQAGRGIEDCYALNKRADKAAVFAGWRDMNDYMRENKMEAVSPQLSPSVAAATKPAEEVVDETKPAKKEH
jgi:hypothetical protein